jgi:hypothetical protein
MFDPDSLCINLILNEEILDVHVLGAFSAGAASIFLDQDRTRVVLVQDGFINIGALSAEEMHCPDQLWHHIMNTNNFSLSRAWVTSFCLLEVLLI